ncbi:probable transcription factor At5g61620 [Cornus florida]|uniref:probable transcription factor At5g61620 n=1 Tax=Cornus florida TaxID=4283 RepID=UPI00289ECA38|nr:probable transcription factor At5g61620 [Cornus florida]
MESGRRCSQCGHNGHNSRTCQEKGYSVKLFGVSLPTAKQDDELIRKTKSTGNLITCNADHSAAEAGYSSDCLIRSQKVKAAHQSSTKKGFPWTEEEHQSFLLGLERLGKGDWKGISKSYVPSRTPTQIASHAQKYFLRISATDGKKRRLSLFDMPFKEPDYPPPGSTFLPSTTIPQISQQQLSHLKSTSQFQVANPMEASKILPMPAAYGVTDYMGYVYFPTNNGNCAPYKPQMVAQRFPGGPSQTETGTSSTKFDGLELTL